MPEQPRTLVNKYEDIVNLHGRRHILAASRTACFVLYCTVLYCIALYCIVQNEYNTIASNQGHNFKFCPPPLQKTPYGAPVGIGVGAGGTGG